VKRLIAIAVIVSCASAVAQGDAPKPEVAPDGADSSGRLHDRYIGKDVLVLEIDDCRQPEVAEARRRTVAFEHFSRGQVLYAQGDYSGAVSELVAAYCTSPDYRVLKDIGQAYERELDYEKAIAYLERFVRTMPPDAKAADACQPDPQDEKKTVLARIAVLSKLKAQIRVDTSPPDARITLANTAGIAQSSAPAGEELTVSGGTYEMTVERAGYHTVTKTVTAAIGKPYTYFIALEPVKGRVHVRVVPADAKLYFNNLPMTSGAFDTEIARGRYPLIAEAPDHVAVRREIDVLPDRDTEIAFELPAQPEYGRKQLLGYGTLAAGAASALLTGVQTNRYYDGLAFGGGVAAGFFGIYYLTPEDLPLGTSSLTITSSLAGGFAGGAIVATSTNRFDATTAAPAIGAGLAVGAAAGYYAGRRTNPTAGDAAVINSGALWGTVIATLFGLSFNASTQISGGIVLSGVGIGTAGGVLLQRYATVSRAHAALIDASGVLGIVGGLATLSIVSRADNTSVRNDERSSNFALAGLGAGLIVGGVLTRHLDEPKLGLSPVLNRAPTSGGGSATTFGVGGVF
jgi:hypothetical protein